MMGNAGISTNYRAYNKFFFFQAKKGVKSSPLITLHPALILLGVLDPLRIKWKLPHSCTNHFPPLMEAKSEETLPPAPRLREPLPNAAARVLASDWPTTPPA